MQGCNDRSVKAGGLLLSLSLVLLSQACATPQKDRVVVPVERGKMALRIVCAPQEAQVRIDGVPQGSCAWLAKPEKVVMLQAGPHRLEVSASGHVPFVSHFSAEGMQQSLTVHLVRAANARRPARE